MSFGGLVLAGLILAGQYTPVTKYDPQRDAAKDIEDAIVEAQHSSRNILLEVGGEWCSWCHILDHYFESTADVLQARDLNYVTVKINWSPENMNQKVLSRYANIQSFPFLVVLDRNGKMLKAQETGVLEQGRGYNHDKIIDFIKKWAPSRN